jgi:hypothetical protein
MNFHYISQSEITLEKYIAWANNPIGKKAIKKKKQRNLISIMGIMISVVGGGFCVKMGYTDFVLIYLAFLAAFICKITIGKRKAHEKTFRSTLAAMGSDKWIRTITFGSNVQVSDNNSTTTFKYSDFRKVGENENYYLLYRDENFVLRVEKGCFITGDESQFRDYLSSRIKNRM